MAKVVLNCHEVFIPHAELVFLRKAGKLNLGIEHDVAVKISATPGLGPTKTTSTTAYHFWNSVSLVVVLFTVYLSFTKNWWWFIIGFIVFMMIFNANKKGNAQNVIDAAFSDSEFYERILGLNGWLYEIEEDAAEKYKIN